MSSDVTYTVLTVTGKLTKYALSVVSGTRPLPEPEIPTLSHIKHHPFPFPPPPASGFSPLGSAHDSRGRGLEPQYLRYLRSFA